MKTLEEIKKRAQSLKGKYISDLKRTLDTKDKGAIGKIIEEFGFGIKNNSESRPDFHDIGLELKVVPLKTGKKGIKGLSVKERTKVCFLNYHQILESDWENSHAKIKLNHVLFVFYQYNKENHLDSQIKDYYFFELKNQLDEPIIKCDWKRTKQLVADGRAHELSESQNKILAASRSGAGGLDLSKHPTQPNTSIQERAPQRSFSLKPSYTNVIWQELNKTKFDTLKSVEHYTSQAGIENFILGRLQSWHGKPYNDLLKHFGYTPSNAKNSTATIIRKVLGFTGNKPIKEIEQLGLRVKTIQCRAKDLMPFEAMSFPHQGIGDLIEEERFDQSEFYSYLQGFLMIPIYKIDKQDPNPIIGKAFIYYPEKPTVLKIQEEWEGYRDRAKNLSITKIPANNKNGFYRESNLPAKTEIIHMRPHGNDGMDLDKTAPVEITKHCFWFNKEFIQLLLGKNQ
jgi:DNA mismatch repair endonuclease MutH